MGLLKIIGDLIKNRHSHEWEKYETVSDSWPHQQTGDSSTDYASIGVVTERVEIRKRCECGNNKLISSYLRNSQGETPYDRAYDGIGELNNEFA